MSELVIKKQYALEVWNTLKESIYPGASDDSVIMVLNYCKAMQLDPMLKPVHIVPMNGKDVIMPGVALYRILAARSGNYAGMSEPEFGPDIEEIFTDKFNKQHKVMYPKWCKITVKKLLDGNIIEFISKEYWKENYATMGRDSQCPNSMWEKRPYGQLAKCCEAQALRKAFPEVLGGMVSSEEMEGKGFDNAKTVSQQEKFVEEVRAKATGNVFPIDGGFLDAMDVHTMISDKIEGVKTAEDLEAYESWKIYNHAGLSEFAKKNKTMAVQYAEAINTKRDSLAEAIM